MNIFSFCIYGSQMKYCKGLVENIKIINEYYPEYYIWIYMGNNVPDYYVSKYKEYKNVVLIQTDQYGASLMAYRFFPMDEPNINICFVRDADSRIIERDRWCINNFLDSDKKVHVIRDHDQHGEKIMGGMWGINNYKFKFSIKKLYEEWIKNNQNIKNYYRTDQLFVEIYIYPIIKENLMIHSNIVRFVGEKLSYIKIKRKNDKDFVGNVYEYDDNDNEYPYFSYREREIYVFDDNKMWIGAENVI